MATATDMDDTRNPVTWIVDLIREVASNALREKNASLILHAK